MRTPHVHAELIKAWADGAEIECSFDEGKWEVISKPNWLETCQYRIKPEPKPDYVEYFWATFTGVLNSSPKAVHNLKLTFDGETGELKSAEVL
jgi:hypothetical protein